MKACALGTGDLAFVATDERVRLPVAGIFYWWQGVYSSPQAAARASAELTETLMCSDEPLARALREEYSIENMSRFVGSCLNRESLVGLERVNQIIIDAHYGVREISGTGTLKSVEVENVSGVYGQWEQLEQRLPHEEMTHRGWYALRRWPELSTEYRWKSVGRIFEGINHHELLNQMAVYCLGDDAGD